MKVESGVSVYCTALCLTTLLVTFFSYLCVLHLYIPYIFTHYLPIIICVMLMIAMYMI